MNYQLISTCKLGLESALKEELQKIGCQNMEVRNGEVEFVADDHLLARTSLWLRTAERILLPLSTFPAMTFDELFEGISEIYWEEIIAPHAKITIVDKCLNSQLLSGRSVQSISKKAIVEKLKHHYKTDWLNEDGPEFKIHVDIVNDQVSVLLDASGAGLHKRGYRAHAGEAPLRETIAAAMILLSKWHPNIPLFDPVCGAGTIPIEAAMIGSNMAPGLNRSFDAENWPFINSMVFDNARKEAKSLVNPYSFIIEGSDIAPSMIKLASENARKAGVEHLIRFDTKDVQDFQTKNVEGVVIANPPYGERLDDVESAEAIYRIMGQVFEKKEGWSYFVLSPHPEFERMFGSKAQKNRKIYNGKIKCYFYSY